MEERYNVYFAGQVMDGCDSRSVRDQLAKLFNADQHTLDKLFSGKAQLIKRDCDWATVTKFRAAMERAGAIPIIDVHDGAAAATKPLPARTMTAAEKIAALAAAPDANLYGASTVGAAGQPVQQETPAEPGGLVLAPAGTEVLRENERAQPMARTIDISGIALDLTAMRLSEEPPQPPAAPDTQHLSMADAGALIPNLPSIAAPLTPAIEGLALTAPGTDFSDCGGPDPVALSLDLSALAVAPAGGTLLEEKYRKQEQTTTPATDHIALLEE